MSNISTRLGKYATPALARLYSAVNAQVFGRYIKVARKHYPKFMALQRTLDEVGASYHDYAVYVVVTWREWCKSIGSVPVNVFCSNKAVERYVKHLSNDKFVDINIMSDEEVALQDELRVARVYIDNLLHDSPRYFYEIVKLMRPVMSQPWLSAYDNDSSSISSAAIKLLCEEYDLEATTYDEIARILLKRRALT